MRGVDGPLPGHILQVCLEKVKLGKYTFFSELFFFNVCITNRYFKFVYDRALKPDHGRSLEVRPKSGPGRASQKPGPGLGPLKKGHIFNFCTIFWQTYFKY